MKKQENRLELKGGCAYFDMRILHSKLIDLDPQDTFCTILPHGFFLFSLLGQKQVCDTGDEAVMKIYKKIKIGIPINMYIFCYNFQSKVNLKLKFWGYNEKNMAFHLTPKKSTTSGWALGDENVIGIRAF